MTLLRTNGFERPLFNHGVNALCALLAFAFAAIAQVAVGPLPRAHAHNDYEHPRPLLDALDHGFCSVEADVWWVNGELRVAHDLKDARPGRDLDSLYLRPLRDRVAAHRGRVFRDGPTFTLLIDFKSDATNTYLALRPVLERHAAMLTRFSQNQTETNAVTVILSGNRPRELMAAERSRLAAYDGRLDDLTSNAPVHFIPLVSDNWARHFSWRGRPEDGSFPAEQHRKLKALADQAHQQGRRIRWWGAPDNAAGWQELDKAGVDLINTDDLAGLERFLRGKPRAQ